MPAACIGVHQLHAWRWWANPIHPSDPCGVQDIEEHCVVEALLGHSGSQVGSDASGRQKGTFPQLQWQQGL